MLTLTDNATRKLFPSFVPEPPALSLSSLLHLAVRSVKFYIGAPPSFMCQNLR